MTRSICDPTGGEAGRSGSTHVGPRVDNVSHMPPVAADGEAGEEENPTDDASSRADESPQTLSTDSAEAARRLGRMAANAPGASQPLEETPPPGHS